MVSNLLLYASVAKKSKLRVKSTVSATFLLAFCKITGIAQTGLNFTSFVTGDSRMDMRKALLTNFPTYCFLFIFFSKMFISAAPLAFSHLDNRTINAVIMQLEIEDNAEKGHEKGKEVSIKEYCDSLLCFSFTNPLTYLESTPIDVEARLHVQTFYPSVPTPPPNV